LDTLTLRNKLDFVKPNIVEHIIETNVKKEIKSNKIDKVIWKLRSVKINWIKFKNYDKIAYQGIYL